MAKFNINIEMGRYRSMLISIAIFLFLITLLLIFTFFTSTRLERNTALVNEVNSISSGAKSVMKDLFDLQNSYGESIRSPHIEQTLQDLESNDEFIASALKDLHKGGQSHQGSFDYTLPKIDDPELLQHINSAEEEWDKMHPKIHTYLEHVQDITFDSTDNLTIAVDQAKISSLRINQSLDTLVKDVVTTAQNEANTIRTVQIFGVLIIFIYFIVFIFFFIRRLNASDEEVLSARKETKEIMETVNTGLFLLDRELVIGKHYSKALVDIMGTDRLGGENFANVLRNRISDKDLEITRQFIEQLYNPRVKSKLVNDLNPLNKIMLHNENEKSISDRYLDFRFSRVYENKKIARILVNVSDVTEAVLLEQRLEKEREQNDLQIEMLTTILNVNPKLINDFINNTNSRIDAINEILKNPGSSQSELENKLKAIYREIHSLKGEASALKLHSFTSIATDAEDKLYKLQNQPKLSGNDFLPLAVHLDDLLNLSNTIDMLGQRINQAAANSVNVQMNNEYNTPTANQVISDSLELKSSSPKIHNKNDVSLDTLQEIKYYQEFVRDIAERQKKQVQLVVEGMNTSIPETMDSALREISIQLIRNAIVHGIETPEVRHNNGKNSTGQLTLSYENKDNQLILAVEDDGAGIDYQAIRNKLVKIGRYDENAVEELSKGQLLNALFSSGFSTKITADEDGGRGVGLDIIKDRVKRLNGKINVYSKLGQSSKFTITLPVTS
ncbi:MAG: Hpt domain-containing protein [Moraxellaceae bacterium]|nr:Hpt domain-containing protein [Moraxellaceae bacterium]